MTFFLLECLPFQSKNNYILPLLIHDKNKAWLKRKTKKSLNILMQLGTCGTSECWHFHGLPMVVRRAFDLSEEMGFENNKCVSVWKETPLVISVMRMKRIQSMTIQVYSTGQFFWWCQYLKLHWLQWSFTL